MTYITLIQLPRKSYPLQKCYSITAWLGKRRRALVLAKNPHAGGKIFLPQQSQGVSACQPPYSQSWCFVEWHERLNGGTCLCRYKTNHVGFCVSCQGCITTYPNTRLFQHSHAHPNTCLTWTLTQADTHTLGRHTHRHTHSSKEPSLAT